MTHPSEGCLNVGQHLVVFQRARSSDHHALGAVVLLEELAHVVRGDRLHVLAIARWVATERVPGEQRSGESAVGDIVRRLVVHRQFFKDDCPLGMHVVIA
ncbi:unannotated protein [freshwater metagenome]|uniref:Unannotated protein n=1 Tax=freshwater metagenome TaxID=449393 RepID=A0A6J7AG14_9ZZZZ